MKHDGKVTIDTLLNNKGLIKGIGNISGSFGGLKSVLGKLTGMIATAFSVHSIIQFGVESSKAAMELSNALQGLQSIVEGQGRSFSKAKSFLDEYVKDGLIPMTNAVTAYKNLAARGYDDSQIQQTLIALKDASAYGRQASYSMGEAVQSATEGLKNENSVLVDNAGVTKNVAKMWDEYAKSIGTTAAKLTQQQKIQAEVSGILEESKFQTGDAAKVAGTLSGQLQQLSYNFNNLKVAVGNAINPLLQSLIPVLNDAIIKVTKFANTVAVLMTVLTGNSIDASASANAVADAYDSAADSADDLTAATTAAGNAAKKSLAGFDELNTLTGNSSTGSSGVDNANGSFETTISSSATSTSGEEVDMAKIQKIASVIKEIAGYIPVIVAGFGGLKLGGFLADLFTANTEVKTLKDSFALLGKQFSITAGATMAVSGLALYITSIYDAITNGLDLINGFLISLGATLSGAGIGLIIGSLGGPIGAGLGALIGLCVGLLTDFGIWLWQNFEKIENWFMNLPLWGQVIVGAVSAIAAIAVVLFNILTAGMSGIGLILPALIAAVIVVLKKAGTIAESVKSFFQSVSKFCSDLWLSIKEKAVEIWTKIKEFFQPAVQWFSELFSSVSQTLEDIFYNIGVIAGGCWEIIQLCWQAAKKWFDEKVIQPISQAFSKLWTGVKEWALNAWSNIKQVLQPVFTWINTHIILPITGLFKKLWSSFSQWASDAWVKIKNILSNIGSFFKGILNGVIGLLNSAISNAFGRINSLLSSIKNLEIMGSRPFANLRTISVPQIPYLAQGAVLPPNKPFMAVVGDQKHGTNIEAPLSTIQEAVAIVMQDQVSAMMAGFDALLQENRQLRQVVEEIEIGDDMIAGAVQRYEGKMAVVRGGYV